MFRALADGTRRAMVARLVHGPASVSQLAEPFDMALPTVVQHLRVLEEAQLVSSEKVGRVRTYQLVSDAMVPANAWIVAHRRPRERQLDRLGDYLTNLTRHRRTDMTDRTQTHATFVLEREYPVPVDRVWAAFADPEIKRKWFGSDEFVYVERTDDFRVGGVSIDDGRHGDGGPLSQYRATYTDITPNERIVYTYDMWLDGVHASTSIATIVFAPTDDGAGQGPGSRSPSRASISTVCTAPGRMPRPVASPAPPACSTRSASCSPPAEPVLPREMPTRRPKRTPT